MARLFDFLNVNTPLVHGDLVIVNIKIGSVLREFGVGLVDFYDEREDNIHLSKYWTFDRGDNAPYKQEGVEGENVVLHNGNHISKTNLFDLAKYRHIYIPLKLIFTKGDIVWVGQSIVRRLPNGERTSFKLYGEVCEVYDYFDKATLNENMGRNEYVDNLAGLGYSWIKPGWDLAGNTTSDFDDSGVRGKRIGITQGTEKVDPIMLEQMVERERLREYVVSGNIL